MRHWRQKNFENSERVEELLGHDEDMANYLAYLQLRQKGLRKDAFDRLNQFMVDAQEWPLEKRFERVCWLLEYCWQHGDGDLIPQPFRRQFIDPTLCEQFTRDNKCVEALRWLGGPGKLHLLRQAVQLNPKEQIARLRLIFIILSDVGYNMHELPSGYLGDPEGDMEELTSIGDLVGTIEDAQVKAIYIASYQEKVELVTSYLDYRDSRQAEAEGTSAISFEDWAKGKGRPFEATLRCPPVHAIIG